MATSLKALYPKNRISSRPIRDDETSRLDRYGYSWKNAENDHPTPSDDYPMHLVNTGRVKNLIKPYGYQCRKGYTV